MYLLNFAPPEFNRVFLDVASSRPPPAGSVAVEFPRDVISDQKLWLFLSIPKLKLKSWKSNTYSKSVWLTLLYYTPES